MVEVTDIGSTFVSKGCISTLASVRSVEGPSFGRKLVLSFDRGILDELAGIEGVYLRINKLLLAAVLGGVEIGRPSALMFGGVAALRVVFAPGGTIFNRGWAPGFVF